MKNSVVKLKCRLMGLFFVIFATVSGAPALNAAEIVELTKMNWKTNNMHEFNGEVKLLCVNGLQFVLGYGNVSTWNSSGVGAGAGVTMVQIMTTDNSGRTVPARCVAPIH